ncbi:hypothetical protein I598_2098 [Isoptericola dokdonensis DS-3]|uniref:Uncharacterized protein n=1 Tax=Isoptericola dokdonensis DS-3 TaxID=1300344 RepID=A0A161IM30_9MICO|nr:hypothetical protein I598_2098 [Isoptericola dokdonensis DS-3]
MKGPRVLFVTTLVLVALGLLAAALVAGLQR